jgi:preprotein translocase subunit SecE
MVYKAGQGTPSRMGAMIIGMLLALFASYSWFGWTWDQGDATHRGFQYGGSLLLFLGLIAASYYFIYHFRRSADYLIDMDVELKKVVWPAVEPLFSPKAEAWGSTYIVIICSAVLLLFIYVVDQILQLAITDGLFALLY